MLISWYGALGAGVVPTLLGAGDYDPDPADQSRSILVLLLPLGLGLLVVTAAVVLLLRSRRPPQGGAEPTHPRPSVRTAIDERKDANDDRQQ
jgi:hypothetical protein